MARNLKRVATDPASIWRPRVFISYSHDSASHKSWVRRLADRLEQDGISVTYDQQDLRLAMSPSSFMEESLRNCDRVLLVVTSPYLNKTNNLAGGVGYERMVITAEMAKDLKTTRFIPILREGEDLPSFLGDRLYVDARENAEWNESYSVLLSELMYRDQPDAHNRRDSGSTANNSKKALSKHHWCHHVQESVGNKLHLIFVKFAVESIKPKHSIVDDLVKSGISDFVTFHLYASQDLLIRAWADRGAIDRLRRKFANNRDLHPHSTPEYIELNSIHHYPDHDGNTAEEISRISYDLNSKDISRVQRGEDTDLEDHLIKNGIRIADRVRFDPERIQFFIIIRSWRPDKGPVERFLRHIQEYAFIHSKSVYLTSSMAVIKGQVDRNRYYDINEFLESVTDIFEGPGISTETILVASPGDVGNGEIDINRAELFLLEKGFADLLENSPRLSADEEIQLKASYAKAVGVKDEDRQEILIGLIKARINNGTDQFGPLRTFFAAFEGALKKNFHLVTAKIYGARPDLDAERKRLLALDKIDPGKINHMVLGDILKVYRRMILDHGIISIDPLKEEEFVVLMSDAPEIRNKLAHDTHGISVWEQIYAFVQAFVRIEHRLTLYFQTLK